MTIKNTATNVKKRKPLKRHGRHFVYILECRDGTYYTGYTVDTKKRVALHNKGRGAKYVRMRLPAKLVYRHEYKYYKTAIKMERKIKQFPRLKKQKMICNYRNKGGAYNEKFRLTT